MTSFCSIDELKVWEEEVKARVTLLWEEGHREALH